MKNRFRLFMAGTMCVIMAMGAAACGSNAQQIGGSSGGETDSGSEDTASGYVFVYDGVKVGADMDMAPIEESLGEPAGYYEEASCAAQGISKIYNYSDFEIYTYPDGDVDRIQTVILKTDNVCTAEGVDLSNSKSDVTAVYGEDYEESNGQIIYRKDGMKLCFIMDEDTILSIEYNSSILD